MGELGSLLTRAREARGLTIEDAERDTRISRRYLQALEAEHFDVIPAPVYARGFLRSYSQYLGLDPQDALALFPREDEPSPYYAGAPLQQAGQSRQAPLSQPRVGAPVQQPAPPVGASRPTWRRPSHQQQTGRAPAPARPRPGEPGWEPTIGVDIGVPAPARRLKTDPAAQARSMTVLIVAVGAIAAVVLVAFAISRLAGDDTPGSASPFGQRTPSVTPTEDGAVAEDTPTTAIGNVTPGVVPVVIGLTEAAATQALIAAGFPETAISATRGPNAAPAGTVFDQEPDAGLEILEGDQAIIAVSDGP